MFGFAIVASAWDGTDKDSLKEYSNYIAGQEGVSTELLQAIIKAESNWNPQAHNPEGSASGLAQYLDSTFRNYCITKYHFAESLEQKNNPFIQINCAVEMLKEPNGWKHWSPSIAGWQQYL